MSKGNDELLYKIAIGSIPGIGDVLAKNLVSYCGGVQAVFRQKKQQLMRIPGIGEKLADAITGFRDFKRAEEELRFIEKHKISALFYLDDDYPWRLRQFQDAPAMLYYLGNADLNQEKIVGVIGTRKATPYGKAFVEQLLEELKDTGCLILSGLAFGIDVHAHRHALKNGLPTVGAMGHGLDRIYPNQHKNIAAKMIEHGGLLTEFPSGTTPDRENFPKRNRVVAGLCDVLVVVETAVRGGAMITAEIANSYNKDVMAVPGRVQDEYSMGCNQLIRQNKAAILTAAPDLFYLMGWNQPKPSEHPQQTISADLTDQELVLVNYLRHRPRAGMDDIAFDLQMDAGDLSLKLLELEFRGLVRSLPGKLFELA